MSNFDPEALLNTEIAVDDIATEFTSVPEGEHDAQITKLATKDGLIGKGERTGEPWVMLNLTWTLTDPNVSAEMNVREARINQSFFLDLDGGKLATGTNKNVALGQLFEACGLDGSATISSLEGSSAIVKVKHKINAESGRTMANVIAVTEA